MNLNTFTVPIVKINYNNIFLLSDTHLGVRANSLEWVQNIQDFFKNLYIPFLKKNVKPGDILFFLGDFFDNRQLLDINVLNAGIDIMLDLAEILPIHIMTGNHDIYKKFDTDINSIVAFKFIPNVTIYEKPTIITNEKNKILIIPWIGNNETEENYVRANKFDYVFAHTDIAGFLYDNGKDINEGTNFRQFNNIKKLFSGHIHKRQEAGNFIYIGSPYHTKRSDIGNKKGFYLFKPQENSFEFTPNNYSPIFQRLFLENILESSLKEIKQKLNNNYSDIIVSSNYIQIFNLVKFIDILKDCKYKKIEVVGETIKSEEINIIESDIKDILTLLELSLNDFGHQMEILIKLKILNKQYYEKANKEN